MGQGQKLRIGGEGGTKKKTLLFLKVKAYKIDTM
jgi:hypothetical protein